MQVLTCGAFTLLPNPLILFYLFLPIWKRKNKKKNLCKIIRIKSALLQHALGSESGFEHSHCVHSDLANFRVVWCYHCDKTTGWGWAQIMFWERKRAATKTSHTKQLFKHTCNCACFRPPTHFAFERLCITFICQPVPIGVSGYF